MAIVSLIAIIAFTSCATKEYMAVANYDVCYPDSTIEYTDSIIVKAWVNANEPPYVVQGSKNGTNYIIATNNIKNSKGTELTEYFILTTAPVRLKNYNIYRIKKNKKINVK